MVPRGNGAEREWCRERMVPRGNGAEREWCREGMVPRGNGSASERGCANTMGCLMRGTIVCWGDTRLSWGRGGEGEIMIPAGDGERIVPASEAESGSASE